MPYKDILALITQYAVKPPLFEPGEPHFWDDPHIAKGMLEAHLSPATDAASRRPETIDKEILNLMASGVLRPGHKVLDLGCGPGLYASRLAARGLKVTGIDISESSIEYATTQAKLKGLNIEYRCMSFFNLVYDAEFDAAAQIYWEIGTFSDAKRDELLAKIHRALRPGGTFIFDVNAPPPKPDVHTTTWDISTGGFWRPGPHLTLEQHFNYPEANARLHQYIIVDEYKVAVYRIWFHDYTLNTIKPVLEKAGFIITHTWNDLSGTPYKEGGESLAIIAKKRF
jgi:SAM-dependent methyltransferase